jgi:hypothetical protein
VHLPKLLVLWELTLKQVNAKESEHQDDEKHQHDQVKERWEGFLSDQGEPHSEGIVFDYPVEEDGLESSSEL